MDKPFCELRAFKRFSDDTATLEKLKGQPVVLIVAPLSGHYATCCATRCAPCSRTTRSTSPTGKMPVWCHCLKANSTSTTTSTTCRISFVTCRTRLRQLPVLSVSAHRAAVLAAISLMASRGESSPTDHDHDGRPHRCAQIAVNDLAVERSGWFENNVIYRIPTTSPGAGRRVYPASSRAGFVAMDPKRSATSRCDYFKT